MLRPGRDLEVHEAIHVGQHFVLGPIFIVSHGIWAAIGAVIGLIAAPIKDLKVADAVTKMSYFNNPYEIMAYATHNGARQDTDDLIIARPGRSSSWRLWILGALALTIGLSGELDLIDFGRERENDGDNRSDQNHDRPDQARMPTMIAASASVMLTSGPERGRAGS